MASRNVKDMATQFNAAYQALKDKKDAERLLTLIKPKILSAKSDGISDKELIDLINALGLREKFYPTKLKELRERLGNAESDVPTNGAEDPPASEESLHPFTAALIARSDELVP